MNELELYSRDSEQNASAWLDSKIEWQEFAENEGEFLAKFLGIDHARMLP